MVSFFVVSFVLVVFVVVVFVVVFFNVAVFVGFVFVVAPIPNFINTGLKRKANLHILCHNNFGFSGMTPTLMSSTVIF